MEQYSNTVLVPWDFTEKAESALLHALQFVKLIDGKVALLNIIKKQKEAVEVTNKLEVVADETEKKYGTRPHIFVREGNIFTTINEVAHEINAIMVVMGTHGMRGLQKFTGSWALKVITGSKAPFVVVQSDPKPDQYSRIVFPVDFKVEDKEKLKWVNFMAQYFKTKIHICYPENSDPFIQKKTKSNLMFAKNYLDSKNIDYEITAIKSTNAEATTEYAERINAGLVIIMTTKNITFQDYVLGADEQQIIANKQGIPVMCINPREGGKFASFS